MIYLLKEPSPAACRPAPTWTDLPAPATRPTPWDLPLPAPWGTPSQLPVPHPTLLVYVPRFPITHPLVPAQRILRHLSLPLFPFILTASFWPFQALLNGSSHFISLPLNSDVLISSSFTPLSRRFFNSYLTALGIFSFLLTYLLISKCSLWASEWSFNVRSSLFLKHSSP